MRTWLRTLTRCGRPTRSAPASTTLCRSARTGDDRPRARQNARVISGKTPDLFEKHCRASLNYIDPRNNLAIIEAWNEWGEGSFIEPDKEFGFAFLDRVRRVYTDAPEATRLRPERSQNRCVQRAERGGARAGLGAGEPALPAAAPAARTTRVTADAPPRRRRRRSKRGSSTRAPRAGRATRRSRSASRTALSSRSRPATTREAGAGAELDIGAIGAIALRLKAPLGARTGEGFWTTGQEPALSGDKSFGIGLKPDGEWHTYQITKQVEGKWSGALRTLRFDLGTAGDTVLIDWIRIYGKEETL